MLCCKRIFNPTINSEPIHSVNDKIKKRFFEVNDADRPVCEISSQSFITGIDSYSLDPLKNK